MRVVPDDRSRRKRGIGGKWRGSHLCAESQEDVQSMYVPPGAADEMETLASGRSLTHDQRKVAAFKEKRPPGSGKMTDRRRRKT